MAVVTDGKGHPLPKYLLAQARGHNEALDSKTIEEHFRMCPFCKLATILLGKEEMEEAQRLVEEANTAETLLDTLRTLRYRKT